MDSKESEEHSLAIEQAQDPVNGGQKKIVLSCPKEKEARKVFRKENEGFHKGGFRTYQPEKGAGNDFTPHKGRGKDQKGKGKEGTYPQSGRSASETPSEVGYGHAWESDDRSSSQWLDDAWTAAGGNSFEFGQPSDARCSGSWLHTVDWIKNGS